jgi:hypothetical protein
MVSFMRRTISRALALAGFLFALLVASHAEASDYSSSCRQDPPGLTTWVSYRTVVLCLANTTHSCGDGDKILRQDEKTGEVRELADFCPESFRPWFTSSGNDGHISPPNPDNGGYSHCYVDECVPFGMYRYGLATPFSCDESWCGGTPWLFTEAHVEIPIGDGPDFPACDVSPGNSLAALTSQAPPWGSNDNPDVYEQCPSSNGIFKGCSAASDARGASADAGVVVLLVFIALSVAKCRALRQSGFTDW